MVKTTRTKSTSGKNAVPQANFGNSTENGDKKIRRKSLIIEGTKYRTRLNKKFETRKQWKAPDPKLVYSKIPGTILKIFVSEGQEVREGELMLILEAMKMKNNIFFQSSGKVKSIHVKGGEKVSKDFLMLEME